MALEVNTGSKDAAGESDGVLAGVRVLDLSRYLAGPIASRILADLGAEVIKVEPLRGEAARGVLPHIDGLSAYFAQHNAAKRCIAVDLKREEGVKLLRGLAAESDVLLENFRPGVMTAAGLGPDTLMADNPRLVYCSVSGYGQSGSWARRRAFAPLVHAETGVLELASRRRGQVAGSSVPVVPEVQSHGDVYPAMAAALAVLAALLERKDSGVGRRIDVSMAQALFYANEWAAAELAGGGSIQQLFGAWNSPVLHLATGEQVAFPGNPVFNFPSWAEAMGRSDLLDDSRFITPAARAENRPAVMSVLQEFVGQFDSLEAIEEALGPFRIPVGQVRAVCDFAAGAWAVERRIVADTSEGIGVPRALWEWDGPSVGVRGGVGHVGSDTDPVLQDTLGMSAAEIQALVEQGVVGVSGADDV